MYLKYLCIPAYNLINIDFLKKKSYGKTKVGRHYLPLQIIPLQKQSNVQNYLQDAISWLFAKRVLQVTAIKVNFTSP